MTYDKVKCKKRVKQKNETMKKAAAKKYEYKDEFEQKRRKVCEEWLKRGKCSGYSLMLCFYCVYDV